MNLARDFRYALRAFHRSPSLIAIIILTLALCTGANTAIFSAIEATLLRPLPSGARASRMGGDYHRCLHLRCVALGLLFIAAVACFIPALRITSLNPAETLRKE